MQQDGIDIKEVQFSNAQLLPEIVRMMNEGHTVIPHHQLAILIYLDAKIGAKF